MTRSHVDRLLSQMEGIRLEADEAETPAVERRLMSEYRRLWRIVEPYLDGSLRYAPEPANG